MPSKECDNLACRRRSASPINRPLTSLDVNPIVASSPGEKEKQFWIKLLDMNRFNGVYLPRNCRLTFAFMKRNSAFVRT